jgi:molybdopterin-containing oxidoreductase family iron-sulfur binding subunit
MSRKHFQRLEELERPNDKPTSPAASERDIPVEEIYSEGYTTSRRDFLKWFGFGVSAATLAACNKSSVRYAIPYVVKPHDITPYIPTYYASFYFDGQEFCNILVKTREGRPIKIEPGMHAMYTGSGTSARVQASVLGVYDSARLANGPVKKDGAVIGWNEAIATLKKALDAAQAAGTGIRLLTSTNISPTTDKLLNELAGRYSNFKVVSFDPVSARGIIAAHKEVFDREVLPNFLFEHASVIVSVGADFLGTWLSAPQYQKGWAVNRRIGTWAKDKDTSMHQAHGQEHGTEKHESNDGEKLTKMSCHYQFESLMTLSGANADIRVPIKPSQEGFVILTLYNALAKKLGRPGLAEAAGLPPEVVANVEAAAALLEKAKGKSLVVSGSNDVHIQVLTAGINEMLGNYGHTIDIQRYSNLRKGNDNQVKELVQEMNSGRVGVVLFYKSNPIYNYHNVSEFEAALSKVQFKVSFADRIDETAKLCDYVLPDNHYLESWNDAEPLNGVYALAQPTISPIFKTMQFQQVILNVLGDSRDYYTYLRDNWKQSILGQVRTEGAKKVEKKVEDKKAPVKQQAAKPKTAENKPEVSAANLDNEWNKVVHDGFYVQPLAGDFVAVGAGDMNGAAQKVLSESKATGDELIVYEKVSLGNGNLANNPWLQEMPDPLTRATWDNYVLISRSIAEEKKLETGNIVKVSANGYSVELPVLVLPGIVPGTIGIALGYGRKRAGGDNEKAAGNIGKNAYPFISYDKEGGHFSYIASGVSIEKTNATEQLALAQVFDTTMGRAHVREATLSEFEKNPKVRNEEEVHLVTLWERHPKEGHYWSMAIDSNLCIGCGNCVVACQVENNVSVVGKDEVRRGREMHWIRIDRYFSMDENNKEQGAAFPEVVFQPIMCQHCDNAPCETVCPVLATTHSSEGLNQMTYNRCIGTRYCANNCPYKVRRFNWFDYLNKDRFIYNPVGETERMVLNPDVTVRARGVMEKCSFCVQRLQAAKLEAKKEGRVLRDGEANTACASSCPTGAIVFGDLNDPESRIHKLFKTERSYLLIPEVKTLPHVSYTVKVRNKPAVQKKSNEA